MSTHIPEGALRFFALGGLGEIGMNCAVIEYGDSAIVLDCGVHFPDSDNFGIEVIIPDMQWIIDNAEKIVGVVVTHGHQDHIGGLGWLLAEIDVPVYAPRFALGLIKEALEEHDLLEMTELFEISDRRRLKLGPFELEFIRVNHSIPDTFAVALRTPAGLFVHSADFKIDLDPPFEPPFDLHRFAELGREGVRAFFADSTNVERPGVAGSESTVVQAFDRIIRDARARLFITMFSTNIFRVQAAIDAAERYGRRIMLLGRSLQKAVQVARDAGCLRLNSADIFVPMERYGDVPASELIVLCTGSQAQPRSALMRISVGDYKPVFIDAGDQVIFSARSIPGNERAIARMKDDLVRRGAHIVDDPDVHVSGHACRDEQRLLLRLVQPKEFVPVHGDLRYLQAHAEVAEKLGVKRTHVLQNGEVLEFGKHDTRVVDKLELTPRLVDGETFGPLDGEGLRARKRLARAGLIIAWLVVDGRSGQIIEGPTLINRGAIDHEAEDNGAMERLTAAVAEAVNNLEHRSRTDEGYVAEAVRGTIRRTLRDEFGGRKPLVETLVYAR